MLAKPGPLPSGRGWWFKPKWNGFRAIIRGGDHNCVRNPRGWIKRENPGWSRLGTAGEHARPGLLALESVGSRLV